jgi:hypothetical protein
VLERMMYGWSVSRPFRHDGERGHPGGAPRAASRAGGPARRWRARRGAGGRRGRTRRTGPRARPAPPPPAPTPPPSRTPPAATECRRQVSPVPIPSPAHRRSCPDIPCLGSAPQMDRFGTG